MKNPDKKLVQTLLQGVSRSCGKEQNASSVIKSFARYTLENDWNFSPEIISHLEVDVEERFPHIRTVRFFSNEKEFMDEILLNTFLWEHFKRNLNAHPLVSLEILNTKYSREALDLPLLNKVGGRRLEFLRQKRGGKYKDLYRQEDQVGIHHIEVDAAKEQLTILLTKYNSWKYLEQWPRSLKTKDAKGWYAAISVLDHDYLMRFFEYEVDVWCTCWLELSVDLPAIAQMKLLEAFRNQEKAVLNGFYKLFLEVDRDDSLGKMDFSILLRALGKKYLTHALSNLGQPDRIGKRWKSAIHLAFSNYQPWDTAEIKPFIEIYKFLSSNKEKDKKAAIWRNIGLNRIGQENHQELIKNLRSEFKSAADYEWLPKLENIVRIRHEMMGAF